MPHARCCTVKPYAFYGTSSRTLKCTFVTVDVMNDTVRDQRTLKFLFLNIVFVNACFLHCRRSRV